ncbi:MAG TPA: histidine kinase dimerization/phosphoacceptor domain -containing protein [Methylomirabilota bacterium]|nr:histidine kinase dimerization/phosphoacceptor domain -containing protein [Methylomirabilota bacterium]
MVNDADVQRPEQLLEDQGLAEALESDRFKHFLDHVPFGVAVTELQPSERIAYVNLEFERLTGRKAGDTVGKDWSELSGMIAADGGGLADSIRDGVDHIGVFTIQSEKRDVSVDVWSNVIEGDDGGPLFRLVALSPAGPRDESHIVALEQQVRDKDTLLREVQHRVKNNLQMITALIRMEARNIPTDASKAILDRLAGRIGALSILYQSLSDADPSGIVDLGVYLSQIASAVLQVHASEGIRLDLKVDTWPVSVNVAMPTGLVVNELLTNALKHAFVGRDGGTIRLHSLVDDDGCRVVVSDDGVGLPADAIWPTPGKLGSLIVQSLRENARASIDVRSEPGGGTAVTIIFDRDDAAPGAEGDLPENEE